MGVESGGNPRVVRLTTWKEIAAFLGRDERTVKRWEESRGLPVRRVPGSGKASVFAYAHELQGWLDGSPVEPIATAEVPPVRPVPFRWIAVAGAAIITVCLVAFLWVRHPLRFAASHDHVATEFYKAGLHDWQTRTPSGLARAVGDFNNALKRDPNYAEAYVGLANTYNLMREYTLFAPDEAYTKARAAATHAIAIDPSLAGAHAALAFVDFYWQRDIAGARREFGRAIELDANNATTHHWYATFLMTVGDFAAARTEIEKAASLDPASTAILADKALILFYVGEPDNAVTLLKQIETDQPLFASPHLYLWVINLVRGDAPEYLRELRLLSQVLHDTDGVALTTAGETGYAHGGRDSMLRAQLALRLTLYARGKASAYDVAENYALLGDSKDAFAYLARSIAHREPGIAGLKINPLLASLHGTPEFDKLVAKAGLV